MNVPPTAIGLPARFENLGRIPGEREAAHARDRGQADGLRVWVDEAGTR